MPFASFDDYWQPFLERQGPAARTSHRFPPRRASRSGSDCESV
jgi:hypothetical protein